MTQLGTAPPTAGPDPELVLRAAAGERDALERLVSESYPRVRRWALAATGDPAEADEVTQEALIRVVQGLASWKRQSRFTTWLFRITANAALDRRRRRGKHDRCEVAIEAAAAVSSPAHDPGARVDLERSTAKLTSAFLALPDRQRQVLDLADLQGFTSPEIAEMLGIAASSVRVTLLLARRALRTRLVPAVGEIAR